MAGPFDRRSFLTRVVGAFAIGGGALAAVTGRAEAQRVLGPNYGKYRGTAEQPTGVSDTDKMDRPGAGRGRHVTGRSDTDKQDRPRYGRTGARDQDGRDGLGYGRNMFSDIDAGDIDLYGRGGPHSEVTDYDVEDQSGALRRNVTGRTDQDGFDPERQGRSGLTDTDNRDRALHGSGRNR